VSAAISRGEVEHAIEGESERRRRAVRSMDWVDTNLWLGEPYGFPFAEELPLNEVATHMDAYSISTALVSHWDATVVSAQEGNACLASLEADLPEGVYTLWTALPRLPGEQVLPSGAIDVPGERVRGVRVFPKTHRYAFASWNLGSLFEWLVDHRLPLFVQHVEVQWQEVFEIATAFPKLTLVIDSQWQKIVYHLRSLFSLMSACSNLYLETSNLTAADVLCHAVEHLGSERLLYGSFAPVSDPLVGIGMVLEADLAAEQKALIAGGNARRLIEEVHW
jgi:predicted TIM-barrel fold metal-dependent hydrolase